MSIHRKSPLPTWRDLEDQLFVRFTRVPLILSQTLDRDAALLLSYLLNHRKLVAMSSPLAIDGRFWIVKAQLARDLQLTSQEQRTTLGVLHKQRFLKFHDESYRGRWSIRLLRRALLRLAQSSMKP
jgi:hypothetical protein